MNDIIRGIYIDLLFHNLIFKNGNAGQIYILWDGEPTTMRAKFQKFLLGRIV